MKIKPNRGSHLPVLMKVVQMTHGPILELGCGIYSTTYLHWMCFPSKRKLVTYENNPDYFDFLKDHETDFHEIHCIKDWSILDVRGPWGVALVDHSPDKVRGVAAEKLANQADYVVLHDTNNRNLKKQGYDWAMQFYKYRWKYDEASPHTSIWSNKFDLSGFSLR